MEILILDTETTELNPETRKALEIGAILWSVGLKTEIIQVSTVIKYEKPIPNPAEPINRIPPQLLQKKFPHLSAIALINQLAALATYVCAHNGSFDFKVCQQIQGLEIPANKMVDTMDINYPNSAFCSGKSLTALAVGHGIPVVDSHRALADCVVLSKLLSTVQNLPRELKRAARPKVLVKSLEPKPGTQSKAHGFLWNSIINFAWAKYMPEEDINLLPFKAVKVAVE